MSPLTLGGVVVWQSTREREFATQPDEVLKAVVSAEPHVSCTVQEMRVETMCGDKTKKLVKKK